MMRRLFDLTLAAFLLVLLSPVMVVVFILILVTMGRPVLFCQDRVGRYGKSFRLNKFRTMTTESSNDKEVTVDQSRITPLGKFLRKTSIDEIPQLWNVLVGDMSLVGPRPLLLEYLPLYSKEQMRRHEVRPGITGWAQVNGRNSISWEEKFNLDVWYVDNQSLMLDLRILLLTAGRVLGTKDVDASSEVTMEKFSGTGSQQDPEKDNSA